MMDCGNLQQLSAEQLGQLYELLQATKEIYGRQEAQDAIEALGKEAGKGTERQ